MAFQPNARRAAIIVCNFSMPDAAFKSENLVSFSMFQARNFVTVTACSVPVNPTTSRRN